MRRPHVYERSVPRAVRGTAATPADTPPATSRHLTRLISNAIWEAEALGLADVVAALEAAMRAAEPIGPADGDAPDGP